MYRPAVPVTLRRAISIETTANIDLLLFSNFITGAFYWANKFLIALKEACSFGAAKTNAYSFDRNQNNIEYFSHMKL